jgi:hypothetical protein
VGVGFGVEGNLNDVEVTVDVDLPHSKTFGVLNLWFLYGLMMAL